MTLAHAAIVFAESHIKHPMHSFNAPVGAGGISELLDRLDASADDKVAPLDADLALDFLFGLDQANCGKLLPAITHRFVHPRYVRNKDRSARFDPAMIFFDCRALLRINIAEIQGLGDIEKFNDRLR